LIQMPRRLSDDYSEGRPIEGRAGRDVVELGPIMCSLHLQAEAGSA
jgi:hypothetical protein